MDPVQRLLSASQQGDLFTVKEYLKQGLSVDIQGKDEVTALQMAATNNQESVVHFLLSSGASVDLPNIYGWTPLMLAARHGHTSIVSMLLKNKARVNAHNKLGMRPLVAAVWNGHTSMVRLLLDSGAISDCPLMTGSAILGCDLTSLMAASLNGHDSILKLLLGKEMSVNQASAATKLTPLMMAACNGHKQTAQILVERGADVNLVNICGKTALDIAKVRGKREVTAYLDDKTITVSIWKCNEEAEIVDAIKDANLEYLKQLLQEDGTRCNQRQMENGLTPLMYAAVLGHVDIVHLLVSSGADLDVQDFLNGWTALMHGVYHRHKAVVHYLVDKGANVNVKAKNDCTALDLACMLDNTDEDVRALLAGKTDSLAEFYRHKSVYTPSAIRRALHSFRKSSDNDRYSAKSEFHKDSPFKAWLGGVAHRFHNLKPTRPSRSLSSTPDVYCKSPAVEKSPVHDSAFCEAESDHINQLIQLPRCSLASLRSPRQFQSDNLKKQSLEAVIPPLPPTPSSDIDREGLCMMSGNRSSNNKRCSPVCLQLTNLLRHHSGSYIRRIRKSPIGLSPLSSANTQKLTTEFARDKTSSMHHSRASSRRWTESANNTPHFEKTVLSPFQNKGISLEPLSANERTLTSHLTEEECINEVHKEAPAKRFSSVKDIRDNLPSLLEQLFLQRYIKKFEDQEVDLEAFQNLTDEDLQEIGVQSLKPRQQLLEVIRHLQQEELKAQTNYS